MKKLVYLLLFALFVNCAIVRPTASVDFSSEPSDPRAMVGMAKGSGDNFFVPVIKFDAVVDDNSVKQAIEFINASEEAGAQAIIIEFNTPGGGVDAGFLLGKRMEDAKVPVVCVVDGMAASMGMYLLQSCDVRAMTKRSVLMTHESSVQGLIGGNAKDFQAIADMLKASTRAMIEHIGRRLNISVDELEKKVQHGQEWWTDWRESYSVGAVDLVVDRPDEVFDSYHQFLAPPANKAIP